MWNLELSPDGSKVVFIQPLPNGTTVARTFSFTDNKAQVALAGKEHEFDVTWCGWANEERLLCGLRALLQSKTNLYAPVTRLVSVGADGSDRKLLLEGRTDRFSQFEDNVIDWLPDDPDHVLVQFPTEYGSRNS